MQPAVNLRAGDTLVLHPELEADFDTAKAYLSGVVGLEVGDAEFAEDTQDVLLGDRLYVPCMFDYDKVARDYRDTKEAKAWRAIVDAASGKCGTVRWLQDQRLEGKMPPSQIVWAGSMPSSLEVSFENGPVWLKLDEEFTGEAQVEACKDATKLYREVLPRYQAAGMDYLIQESFAPNDGADGSNQYFATDEGLYFLGTTVQLVSNGKHYGNIVSRKVEDCGWITHELAEKLYSHGLRGFFGIDFRRKLGTWFARVIEFNLRVNGSSCAILFAAEQDVSGVIVEREVPVSPALTTLEQVYEKLARNTDLQFNAGNASNGGSLIGMSGWFGDNRTVQLITLAEGDDIEERHQMARRLLAA
jgi:hypothetical protein